MAKEMNSPIPEDHSQKKEKEKEKEKEIPTTLSPTQAQILKEREKQIERDIQLHTMKETLQSNSNTPSPQPPVLSAKAANQDTRTFNSLNQSVTDLVNLMDENKKSK